MSVFLSPEVVVIKASILHQGCNVCNVCQKFSVFLNNSVIFPGSGGFTFTADYSFMFPPKFSLLKLVFYVSPQVFFITKSMQYFIRCVHYCS